MAFSTTSSFWDSWWIWFILIFIVMGDDDTRVTRTTEVAPITTMTVEQNSE